MEQYDVVVVGAGIQGAGIAQAASAAGHSVLLLEKRGIASGTSSKSSKLIHGGLRYLESGQLRLVHESLRERRIMLAIAPDLVRLVPFHLPVYRETRRRAWQLRVGLAMYAALAGFAPGTRFGALPRDEWGSLDGLETRGLQTVLRYFDAQTDDAALTRAVVESAQSLGTRLVMPAEFFAAALQDDGAVVRFVSGGVLSEVATRVLVNAGGAWVTEIADRVTPAIGVPTIDLVQGTHILVPGSLQKGIYYVESPRDGRAVFVMPWAEHTLVGTTETRFRGDPDRVEPHAAEKHYLLSVLRRYFPKYAHLGGRELLGAFAGLRVLPAGRGHAFHRSRETALVTDRSAKPRVLGVYGGKLTGWRATAEHAMRRIASSLAARRPVADTTKLRLTR